jgi:hypothetical protein
MRFTLGIPRRSRQPSRREAPAFTTVEVDIDLQTVICQVPSVSRESVAAAKLQQANHIACSHRCSQRLRRDDRAVCTVRATRGARPPSSRLPRIAMIGA